MSEWSHSGYHKLPKETNEMLKKVDESLSMRHRSIGKEKNTADLNNTI